MSIEAILRLAPDNPAPGYEQTFRSVLTAGIDAFICAAMNFTLVGMLRDNLWGFDRMGFVSAGETYLFDHVAEPSHAEEIRGRRLAALRSELSPRSFWSLRDRVFPNLLFGLDVQGQVNKLNTTIVPLMFKRLAELDARARAWRESADDKFPDGVTEIKRETPRTMARYGNDRRFCANDGVTKTFEHHMWIDRGHRIHLLLDAGGKRVEIGTLAATCLRWSIRPKSFNRLRQSSGHRGQIENCESCRRHNGTQRSILGFQFPLHAGFSDDDSRFVAVDRGGSSQLHGAYGLARATGLELAILRMSRR